jgi:hypothetical protein
MIPSELRYRLGVVSVPQHGGYTYWACKLYEAKKRKKDGVWTYRPIKSMSKDCRSPKLAMRLGQEKRPDVPTGFIRFGSIAYKE